MGKVIRKPKFRPSKRTENRFVIAFKRSEAKFLDSIENKLIFGDKIKQTYGQGNIRQSNRIPILHR